ncbi:unnamed protein product [Alopecurus aequalis]
MMEGSSSSLARAVAILAAIFICCSLPSAAAIKVHPDGNRVPYRPPPPRAAPPRCNYRAYPTHCGKVPPTSTPPSTALTPHRKTLQQAVANRST